MELVAKDVDDSLNLFELFDTGYLAEAEGLYNECLSIISDTNSNEYAQVLHGLGM